MRESADVCVVGAGPAGLTVAQTLGARGRRVILLESGGLETSATAQELNDGDCEGEPYSGLAGTRHRQMGGTANTWNVGVDGSPGAKYVPLSVRDLADWPIGWDELEPFYVDAQRICGLGPLEYGAVRWTTPGRRPFELTGTGLESGVYQFGYARRFTRELVDEVGGMASVMVVTPATVTGLELGRAAREVENVRAVVEDGRRIDVEARTVVLACGAVENARLLLLSGLRGGGSTWLGRCFMEHARDFSLRLVPSSPGVFADAAFYDLWASEDGFLVGGHLALTDDALNQFDLPNAALTLVPHAKTHHGDRLFDRLPEGLRHALGRPPLTRYGWSRVRSPERAFDRFDIVLNLEHRPHPDNRVELGTRLDRFANPLPRLWLHWADDEQESLERLRRLLHEWFRTARIGELMFVPGHRPNLSAHHHAGTTRMARDPRDGPVDPDGRVFGVDNLYVTGASVFPSAGFANPMLTIVALARRIGVHVDTVLG